MCSHILIIEPSVNTKPKIEEDNKETEWDLSGYLCELEECLQDVLSEVLETEMKAAYDDLWLEVHFIFQKLPLRFSA